MKLSSYVCGKWHEGAGQGVETFNAITGTTVCHVSSEGIDFAEVVRHGREAGGKALRAMTFHERALALKNMAKALMADKEKYYEISAQTGATRADGWVDIEGGLGTVFSYASLATRELPNDTVLVEGDTEVLSKQGSFLGRHILTSKPGVSVHINAFNFPIWGMLEKIAPSLIAGVPVIVKPATPSAYLSEAMVRDIVAGGYFPEGAIQIICGSVGDLLDHLGEQDVVTFTGSASTGRKLRTHPNIIANSIPFTMEADSLNAAILGKSVSEDDPEFDLFLKEVAKEMTIKAGQKCTAIRRVIAPRDKVSAVIEGLSARLDKIAMGDSAHEGVRMGALISRDQVRDVAEQVARLSQECEIVHGGSEDFDVVGADKHKGAFYPKTILYCDKPFEKTLVHEIEAFGPVTTVMPYDELDDAINIAKLGKGSLVASVYSYDAGEIKSLVTSVAAWHGRMLILNRDCAKESTGHGSPLMPLVHGGPGRAGGGEELGGLRAVKHYMQRTAIQGSPRALTAVTSEYHRGAVVESDGVHPFRKYFEDLIVGETLVTHRRTVSEADIVNFGCLSGDHFYAHFDEIAAKDSFFGKRVAHGYFVLSAAAGMFVDPAKGPVIANYGLESLRFIEPVGIGDTIQAKLTVKKKIKKAKRGDEKANGVVQWAIEVINQHDELVAVYDIMTLVERREDD
ncbi:phenylacetic acid degradation bifunctional protein PaaZ [Spongiibacter sp. KMU-166]|uniref:Phenylacetic acid degradation bifunctional protein PaaZ n=1 Tax=Spongiibacter thalassae TaxID=2721624 RepID=A0ABX1GHF9_9GAMM|nr:phenylacetic acid degradation bifunctional protein PaaZ [Spongiibacter thalassae]NKI18640.1 phenylacetic acid degradation bifunctional protein PaaZ [Spongiibacter thalassae]